VTDSSALALYTLVTSSPSLAYLDLNYTPMTHTGLTTVLSAASTSPSLLYYQASTIHPQSRAAPAIVAGQTHAKAAAAARAHMARNIKRVYGDDVSYDTFLSEHKRSLVNDEASVRKIDSVYRNRDAGLARRKLKTLDKWWKGDDGTLEKVMGAVGPVCTKRR
jgi:hypothetical protein